MYPFHPARHWALLRFSHQVFVWLRWRTVKAVLAILVMVRGHRVTFRRALNCFKNALARSAGDRSLSVDQVVGCIGVVEILAFYWGFHTPTCALIPLIG